MGEEGFQAKDLIGAFAWGMGQTGAAVGSMLAPVAAGAAGGSAGAALGSAVPVVGTVAGGTVGSVAGAWSVGTMLNTGEAYLQFKDEGVDPQTAAEWAWKVGLAVGLVDSVGLTRVMGATALKGIRKKTFSAVGKQFAAGYGRGAAEEGVTEMIQSAMREATAAALTDNPNVKERALSTLQEGFAGALGGGFIGGVGRGGRAILSKPGDPAPAGHHRPARRPRPLHRKPARSPWRSPHRNRLPRHNRSLHHPRRAAARAATCARPSAGCCRSRAAIGCRAGSARAAAASARTRIGC